MVSQNKIISEKNILSRFDDDDDDDDEELRTISEVIGRPNFVVHALHRVTRSPISNISSNLTMHTYLVLQLLIFSTYLQLQNLPCNYLMSNFRTSSGLLFSNQNN